MAVRNLDAINRKREQMDSETQQRDNLRRVTIQTYINAIRDRHDDIVDATDTYKELIIRKIPIAGNVSSQRIKFHYVQDDQYKERFHYELRVSSPECHIHYNPYIDMFEFYGNGTTSKFFSLDELTAERINQFFYRTGYAKERSEQMLDSLHKFAETLPAFLNNLFNYVENL